MGRHVFSAWLATVKKNGSRCAIYEADGGQVSFADLQQRVMKRCDGLSDPGGWRNRVVALQMENSADWLEAFLTCQAVGAIPLPFDTDVPRDGVLDVLAAVRPAAIWTHDAIEPLDNPGRRRPACLVKLTSGSTGAPRTLFFEDEQMLADGRQVGATMKIRPSDTNLCVIPLGHSYGLGNLVMPLIQLGTAIAVCKEPFPHSIAQTIQASRATVVPAVPAILRALSQAGVEREKLSSVRLWISAGSRLEPADARLFAERIGRRIHNFYGSSETGGIAYDRSGRDSLTGRSVGRPMEGVHTWITASGRLGVASKAVFRRCNPLRHGGDSAYVMPDIAMVLEDGCIALAGRRSRMVKMAGRRVSLSEIERQLAQVKGVRNARVVDYRSAGGRTRLAAIICPELPVAEVRQSLGRRLPAWKIPDKWLAVPDFPLSKRGKVDFSQIDKLLQG